MSVWLQVRFVRESARTKRSRPRPTQGAHTRADIHRLLCCAAAPVAPRQRRHVQFLRGSSQRLTGFRSVGRAPARCRTLHAMSATTRSDAEEHAASPVLVPITLGPVPTASCSGSFVTVCNPAELRAHELWPVLR